MSKINPNLKPVDCQKCNEIGLSSNPYNLCNNCLPDFDQDFNDTVMMESINQNKQIMKEILDNFSEEIKQEAFKIVNDNNIETKLIGYMSGVNEQALHIATLEHTKAKSWAIVDTNLTIKIKHENKLMEVYFSKHHKNILQVDDMTWNKQYAVIEMLSGKFDVIIFKTTSRVNRILNQKGWKFFFVYPHKNMREICLKQVIDDGTRTADYMEYSKNFDQAIDIIDNEISLFMVKIKFVSYASLSQKLENELKI